jgi:hypothetical protein
MSLHGLETHPFLIDIVGEDAEFTFLCRRPVYMLAVELERGGGIRNVVVCVVGVNVECIGEEAVTLKTETFVVALQSIAGWRGVVPGCLTLDFLLPVLARTGDEGLGLAWFVFFTRVRCVASVAAGMIAGLANFAAGLSAVRAGDAGILALAGTMAKLLALMRATLQLLPAGQTAAGLGQVARLVLERLLSADARLLDQEGALWAFHVVGMALMRYRGMATGRASCTFESAFRRSSPARLRRL